MSSTMAYCVARWSIDCATWLAISLETFRKVEDFYNSADDFHFRHVPLHGLEAIWKDDKVVGFLRRADYGFSIGKSIGYGYVTHPEGKPVTNDFMKSGTYFLEHMGIMLPAKIYTQSPFDPKNQRVKGVYL